MIFNIIYHQLYSENRLPQSHELLRSALVSDCYSNGLVRELHPASQLNKPVYKYSLFSFFCQPQGGEDDIVFASYNIGVNYSLSLLYLCYRIDTTFKMEHKKSIQKKYIYFSRLASSNFCRQNIFCICYLGGLVFAIFHEY